MINEINPSEFADFIADRVIERLKPNHLPKEMLDHIADGPYWRCSVPCTIPPSDFIAVDMSKQGNRLRLEFLWNGNIACRFDFYGE